jgi:hypothetical protein
MKIIITESQNDLLRRLGVINNILDEIIKSHDPCEYSRYEQYKRIVANQTIDTFIFRENLWLSIKTPQEYNEFKSDIFFPYFEEKIKEYYDSFDDKC